MEYPLAQTGGVETLVRALTKGLEEQFEIVLVSDDNEQSLLAASGETGKIVAHLPWRFGQGSSAEALAEQLARLKVQLAHFHFGGPFAWDIRDPRRSPLRHTRRQGIPCVLTNHWVRGSLEGYCGDHRSSLFKLALWPGAWAARALNLQAAECEITVSKADCHQERRNIILWPHKIRSLYHSILDENESIGGEERVPVILCLGTIAWRKGQDVLIEAFARLAGRFPDWKLILAGRVMPELESTVRELAQEVEAQVEFPGEIRDAQEVRSLMQRAAIFAMPSRSEGLGLSLQEALFRGCACIGSRVGGIPELIEHESNGLLVSPHEPAALAVALERMMTDSALRQKFGEAGRASILEKGMTRQRMIRNHLHLYEDILSRMP